jgi:uncharacterized protein
VRYGRGVVTIGVISDTHGLLRPEARSVLASVDRIIHGGDIDDPQTLQWLSCLGSVTAVKGNCDRGSWAKTLPTDRVITVEGLGIYVIHDLGAITIEPKAAGIAVVVSGHSHRPHEEWRDGVLYFNPGSAGPRRFNLPISMGKLHIGPSGISSEIITLG